MKPAEAFVGITMLIFTTIAGSAVLQNLALHRHHTRASLILFAVLIGIPLFTFLSMSITKTIKQIGR